MSFRALHIAQSALLAHQAALEVASGNIANATTPGYARRRAQLSPIVPEPGHVGTGVRISSVESFRSHHLDAHLRSLQARWGWAEMGVQLLQRLEAVLGEPSETGVSALLQRFFAAVQEAALRPEDIALRELVLQRAEELSNAFRRLGVELSKLRSDTLEQLQQRTERLNHLLRRLAEVNTQRAAAPVGSEQALSLADEQARLLEELARLAPVSASVDARGMATVAIAGQVVVEGGVALSVQLRMRTEPGSGEQIAELWLSDPVQRPVSALSLTGGELGGLLWHFNVTLDPQETGSFFSLPRELNRFVARWVERVNSLVASGYGLADSATSPPGRRLFEGNTLDTLRLSADVAADPRALPFADAPGEPGNARIAQKLVELAEDPSFAEGQTPSGVLATIFYRLGSLMESAQAEHEWVQASIRQVEAQRQALAGVNLDEEALALIRFQKAYEAAARVATVAASLLETLVRMGA